jgi:hypothetical protein
VRSRWDSSAASRSWPIRRRNTALICCRKSPEMPGLDRLAVLMLADGRHCAHVYYTGRGSFLPYVDAVTITSNYFQGWSNGVSIGGGEAAARNWLIGPNAFVDVGEKYADHNSQHAIFTDGAFRHGD